MGSTLFSPFKTRGVVLPNRIVVSPMGQCSAHAGCATNWHLMHLGHLAMSGAGLLITEVTVVHPNGCLGSKDLGLWCDENEAALAPVVAFCRSLGGARLGIQLGHAGRKGSMTPHLWENQHYLPEDKGGWTTYAASPIPYAGRGMPVALDKNGIDELIGCFAAAAERADRLGFDVIEIHAAHGYLIHNFLSPLTNHRDDEYGGSRKARMRFALEIFKAVRDVWPERKPLGVRISATDWYEGGLDIEDSVEFARALHALGCDFVTASSGGAVLDQKLNVHPGYQVPFAARIRKEAGIATMAVGLITEPHQAAEIVDAGQADLVALGRGMLYNPRWPWHAAMKLGEDFFYPPQYSHAHTQMRDGKSLQSVPVLSSVTVAQPAQARNMK